MPIRLDPAKLDLVREASIKAVTISARRVKAAPKLPDPRRYDYYGRPTTGTISYTERISHSQVWSRRQTALVNRFDERDNLIASRAKPVRNSNLPTFRASSNGSVTRVSAPTEPQIILYYER